LKFLLSFESLEGEHVYTMMQLAAKNDVGTDYDLYTIFPSTSTTEGHRAMKKYLTFPGELYSSFSKIMKKE